MAKPHRAVRIAVVALVVTAAVVALSIYLWQRTQPQEIVLSGTIEAHDVSVGSLVGGRVKSLGVVEGSTVQPGTLVAVLETEQIERQLAEQQAVVDAAKAQLDKAIRGPRAEEIEKANVVYSIAERDRKRYASLLQQGIVSREQYEALALKAETAGKDLELLRKGTRSEDVAAARAEVERARRRIETLRQQESESVVSASVAGTVQAVAVRPGDLVAPNQPIAEIVETSHLWVRVYVPETLLGLVRVGMPASISTDTNPAKKYRGQVVQINAKGEYTPRNVQTRSQRAEQVFGVRVDLEPNPDLKPGMAADVDLGIKGKI